MATKPPLTQWLMASFRHRTSKLLVTTTLPLWLPEMGRSLAARFVSWGPILLEAALSPGPRTRLCQTEGRSCLWLCMLHHERSVMVLEKTWNWKCSYANGTAAILKLGLWVKTRWASFNVIFTIPFKSLVSVNFFLCFWSPFCSSVLHLYKEYSQNSNIVIFFYKWK